MCTRRHSTVSVLIVLIVIGGILRFADVGTESLWVDELYSYRQAVKPIHLIIANARYDVHPPTYYIILHGWSALFGTTEIGLRSLSVVFGTAAIPLLYVLGRDLFSHRIGLYAAALLTFSHFHIRYSQEARSYAYVVLVVIIGMISFVRYLRLCDKNTTQPLRLLSHTTLLSYICSTVLVLYSHFFALFVVLAQNIFIILYAYLHRERLRHIWQSWALLQFAVLILFLPWLHILWWQVRSVQRSFWITEPSIWTLLETVIEYAGSLSAASILLPCCILAWIRIRQQPMQSATHIQSTDQRYTLTFLWTDPRLIMLALWVICPILLPYILSHISTPIYYIKYTIPALPAFLLLAAHGLDALDTRVRSMRFVLCCTFVLLGILALRDNYNDWNALEKEPWKLALSYLDKNAAPHSLVLVHDWYCAYNCLYYSQRSDLRFQPIPPERLTLTPSLLETIYQEVPSQQDQLWFIISHATNAAMRIQQRIEQDFRLKHDTTFPSRYRKYMVLDTFPLHTKGLFLMKTYLSHDIRMVLYERKHHDSLAGQYR